MYGESVIQRARQGDAEAKRVAKRRAAKMSRSLRLALDRKSKKCARRIDHAQRRFRHLLAQATDVCFIGQLHSSVLGRKQRGRRFSLPRRTKWVLQRAHVLGMPAALTAHSKELQRWGVATGGHADGFLAGPGARADAALFHAVEEAYTTSLCACCGTVVDLGGRKMFRCPSCGLVETRDGGAARKILVAALLGATFDVREAWRLYHARQEAAGDGVPEEEEEPHTKERDIDSDDDAEQEAEQRRRGPPNQGPPARHRARRPSRSSQQSNSAYRRA